MKLGMWWEKEKPLAPYLRPRDKPSRVVHKKKGVVMKTTGVVTLWTHGGRFESSAGATLHAGSMTRTVQRGVMVPPKIAVSKEIDPSRIECIFPKKSGLWLCGVGHPASVRFESDCGKTYLIENIFETKPHGDGYDIAASLSGDPAWEVE